MTHIETVKPLVLDSSKQKIWFTSDLHISHRNIIRFCNRPWETTEEMDEALIEGWNSVVGEDDLVFDLGDFAFAPNSKWKETLERLNGHHYLVLGNHEITRWPGDKIMELFERVENQMLLKIDGRFVYLNHYPLLCYAGVYRGKQGLVYQLHGHVHLSKVHNEGKDFERMSYSLPTQYDVGVDFNDYKPISWEEVCEKINYQIENNTNQLCWIKPN